jgi:hypothetical protein
MKFDLTLTTVLVFFVPGGLLLLGVPADAISSVDRWHILYRPTSIIDAGSLLSAIFFCGAVIDSVRTITVQPLVTYIAKGRCPVLPDGYFKFLDKDSIVVFQFISDKAFEYLRLNQNITLALLLLFIFNVVYQNVVYQNVGMPYFVALALGVVWLVISVRSRIDLYSALRGFVDGRKSDGGPAAENVLTVKVLIS